MSIELGGKNPNIVFADADFEAAVDGALFGAFANQGEVCSAGSRLLVERSIYDRMLRGDRRESRQRITLGDPLEPRDEDGAAGHGGAPEKVLGYIEIGKKEGRLVTGGGRAAATPALARGCFVEPTIFADVDNSRAHRAGGDLRAGARVIPFDDEAEARAHRERHALRAGRRGVDARRVPRHPRAEADPRRHPLAEHLSPDLQRGAVGRLQAVRLRPRAGPLRLEDYLETKQINLNLTEAPIGWY